MKMIQLKSSDDEIFDIEEEAASGSQTIKSMIEDECTDSAIPLPNVDSKILAKIVEYLKKHVAFAAAAAAATSDEDKKAAAEEKEAFDKKFVNVDENTLFDLIKTADYLIIQSLLDLTCQTVANMIIGKNPQEIRRILNIKNDYTPEEEEEVRRDNAWAFE